VKLVRIENDHYIFQLGKREKELFALVLRLYPVIPSAHQPLSKSSATTNKANQHLLDEALAEQRNENKKLVETLLADPKRFHETPTTCRVTLTAAEIEWLLQVLNDVRVGNWILLGSPEEELWTSEPTEKTAPYVWAMHAAGLFQMNFLEAMNGKAGTG
jgi:hypothetical protein